MLHRKTGHCLDIAAAAILAPALWHPIHITALQLLHLRIEMHRALIFTALLTKLNVQQNFSMIDAKYY